MICFRSRVRLGVFLVLVALVFGMNTSHGDYCPLSSLDELVYMAWPSLDLNGDHGLSFQELNTALPPEIIPDNFGFVFHKMDANGNGLIDPPEARNLLYLVDSSGMATLADLDLNGDGVIQLSEALVFFPESLFHMLDRNADGVLDCDDVPPWPPEGWTPPIPEPCRIYVDMDALYPSLLPVVDLDGNGRLSQREVLHFFPELPAIVGYDNYWEHLFSHADYEIGYQEFASLFVVTAGYDFDLVRNFDQNQDRFLDREELAHILSAEEFDALDNNGNGYIDCESFEAFIGYILERRIAENAPFVRLPSRSPWVRAGSALTLRLLPRPTKELPSFQWYHNGVLIPWADEDTLVISHVTAEHSGAYYCVVTDETFGPTQSNTQHIIVVDALPLRFHLLLAVLVVLLSAPILYRRRHA